MKLLVVYPQPGEELEIVKNSAPLAADAADKGGGARGAPALSPVLGGDALGFLRNTADSIHIDDGIGKYIVSIVTATRPVSTRAQTGAAQPKTENVKTSDSVYRYVTFGASPRASIALYRCSRILAMFEGRSFVSPEDVKAAAFSVLRHRIVLSYEAEAEGMDADAVIARILSHVPVP
jgi:MoxR-like ATPase